MIVKVLFTACVLLCLGELSYASIKVSSYNIRNFGRGGSYTDLTELTKILTKLDSDIIGVQEIVSKFRFKKYLQSNFSHYRSVFSKCGGRGEQHLGFIYNTSKLKLISSNEENEISDLKGILGCRGSLRPILIGKFVEIKTNKTFVAMVVHLKAGGARSSISRRAKQYKIIAQTLKRYESKGNENIIVMGDFNTTGYISQNNDFKNFKKLISNTKTFDISSKINCTSYWSGAQWDDNIEEPSVLDHILFSKNIKKSGIKDIKVSGHCQKVRCKEVADYVLGRSYEAVSDHCPISATIN